MIRLLKRAVKGSPFELPMRRLHRRIFSSSSQSVQYDRETVLVMKRVLHRHSNCIDAGSNEGLFLAELLRLAPAGVHYAFEPVPELARNLEFRFPRAKVFNIALADAKGRTTFYEVLGCRGLSCLRKRNHEYRETEREITVNMDCLDNVIPTDVPIDFIKIDVEGAELLVLKGAVETIRRNKPIIVFECMQDIEQAFGFSAKNVYDVITKDCRFKIHLMESWLRKENAPLEWSEFEAEFQHSTNHYFMACE